MSTAEIDSLLVRHLPDLDFGARRLTSIQVQVAKAINRVATEWADANGWQCVATWPDGEVSLGLPEWIVSEFNWTAWLELDVVGDGAFTDSGTDEDTFWLTALCGQGQRRIGLAIRQDRLSWTRWKRFLLDNKKPFEGTSFVLDDRPNLFLPVVIDQSVLADSVAKGTIEYALNGLTATLDAMRKMRRKIDNFVDKLAQVRP